MKKSKDSNRERKGTNLWNGLRQALPIVLGYIPVGFAYGVLAQKNGLGMFNAVAMSVIVFAGSSQLIGAGLFGAAASPFTLIFTTFVVNLRHLLMSATLAPKLKGWMKWQIALFGYELTDETFALHTMRMAKKAPPKVETFTVNITAQSSWVIGSLLGYLAGGQLTDVRPIGLDFALPAMFIALLVPQVVKPVYLMMALLAAGLSVTLYLLGFGQSHVIIATIVAATTGIGVEQWMKNSSS